MLITRSTDSQREYEYRELGEVLGGGSGKWRKERADREPEAV